MIISDLKTNENGKIVINNYTEFETGTYYLVEKKAPYGYLLSQEKIPFTVKASTSETIVLTPTNEKIKTNIQKQDEFGNLLSNSQLGIKNNDTNEEVYTFISKETPEILSVISELPAGKYTIYEKLVPEGYIKADDIEIELTDDKKVIINGKEVTDIIMIDNLLRGTIKITKEGEILKDIQEIEKYQKYNILNFKYVTSTLEKATYELYAKNDIVINGTKIYNKDEKIIEKETDSKGIATFENLPTGDYYVVEKIAPEGHEVDSERHEISLMITYDENNNPVMTSVEELTDERIKEKIEITKLEKGTDKTVENAIYGLYNKEKIGSIEPDTLLDVTITGIQGKASFDVDLPIGNYYIKEIKAPDGYMLSNEVYDLEFNESKEFKINVEEEATKVIIKTLDKNGDYLKGVTLKIKDSLENIVDTWETEDSEHIITGKLKVGEKYVLSEENVPKGFIKAEDKEFIISENDDGKVEIEMISKEEPKEEQKEEPKEEQKEEPKEEQKEEPKDETKEEPKEEPKDETKEEEPKEDETKEELKQESSKNEVMSAQTGDALFVTLIIFGLAIIGCGATFVLKELI